MTYLIAELVVMLCLILLASLLFTNALEHLGARLKISEGITASLFAAIATALPETLVPLLALFAGTGNVTLNAEVGMGAILGAPLMLSTLSTCLMALAVLHRRGIRGRIKPERRGLRRDLNFFLFAFALAIAAMYVPPAARYLRATISIALVFTYCMYTLLTLRASQRLVEDGYGTAADAPMYFARGGLPVNLTSILVQLGAGLVLLIFSAEGFIRAIEGTAHILGISALLLSLLIIPIATELPEKINSILWIRRNKDTLAVGNITGALVFQGTLLPAIGIMFTPWQPHRAVLAGVLITLGGVTWIRLHAQTTNGLPIWGLLVNGAFYLLFLGITLAR